MVCFLSFDENPSIFYPSRPRLGMASRICVYEITSCAWHHHRCISVGLIPCDTEVSIPYILIKAKNDSSASTLIEKYDGMVIEGEEKAISLQAISPMSAVRDVLNDADNTKYIVYVLCAVILVMNIMIISIITLLNMYHSSKEISLMRLIGISMKKINLLYIIQNSLIGFASVLLAFGLSRICLALMNDYVSSMGVVLNIGRIYPLEIVILVGVFLISVLPTAIWTFVMSHKDSISD